MTKRIFTIPPQEAFLERLAQGLWKQAGRDPLKLGEMLVFLPTRRAGLYLRMAFLRVTGGHAALLPRIQALGDLDESEFYFSSAHDLDPALPPAISPLRRQLLLARMIRARDRGMPLDQAAQLAAALAKLLDEVQTEGGNFGDLKKLVPEDYAQHWQETVRFLEILTANWPQMLTEEQALDPAERRNRLFEMRVQIWRKHPPMHPVIAAGSTGSIPATANLLDVIAGLPHGMVVLPGLDRGLEEDVWQAVSESHPQFGMKQLLEKFGIERGHVELWPVCNKAETPRVRLLQEAMRPAEVSEGWRSLKAEKIPSEALQGLSRLTLENAQEEASAIALIMRGVLETRQKTALLVTSDRDLAARVAAQLARWGIVINDSAGAALPTQPIGGFLLALLDVARPGASAVEYLTLLKHPFAACGLDPALCRSSAREIELEFWRAYEVPKKESKAMQWLAELQTKFVPLREMWQKAEPLGKWLGFHLDLAEQIAATDVKKGSLRLWKDEAGEAAATWCDEWRDAAHDFPALTGREYADLFRALLNQVVVRPMRGAHPRLGILGPLEARLIQADLMILGGLNEGVWPPEMPVDPWMSRPMKRAFDLPLPERRLGLSAHDFVQLASAPEVVLTRARRMGHAPAVPSRFLLQLETVLQALGYHSDKKDALSPLEPWLEWVRLLDEPSHIIACAAPTPKPPPKTRPRSLHVTEIGRWQRNPYAIYARHILGLTKLEPLEQDASAAERGIVIHNTLEQFLRRYPDELPSEAQEELCAMGREIFAAYPWPEVAAFWWPRFERAAAWFIKTERKRRASGIKILAVEAKGELPLQNGTFVLKGRADRIDQLPDGTLEIIDYKTGGIPSQKDVREGYEPQLPLLACMAADGAFHGVAAGSVSKLAHWQMAGSEAGEEKPLKDPPEDLAKAARAGLEELIARFADPTTPYLAAPKPGAAPRYDDYAHLARLAEWGRTAEEA